MKKLAEAIIKAAHDGYHNRSDYPPYALSPWEDRNRWAEYIKTVAIDVLSKIENKVYLVTKNADFIEGRGPMLPHKIFSEIETARDYIKSQCGVYGSKQYKEPYNMFGGRYLGDLKTEIRNGDEPIIEEMWNGYSIQEVEVQ